MECLTSLTELNLRRNAIADAAPIASLPSLRVLSLSFNLLPALTSCAPVCSLTRLEELSLEGNPLCRHACYPHYVIAVLPALRLLDQREILPDVRASSVALFAGRHLETGHSALPFPLRYRPPTPTPPQSQTQTQTQPMEAAVPAACLLEAAQPPAPPPPQLTSSLATEPPAATLQTASLAALVQSKPVATVQAKPVATVQSKPVATVRRVLSNVASLMAAGEVRRALFGDVTAAAYDPTGDPKRFRADVIKHIKRQFVERPQSQSQSHFRAISLWEFDAEARSLAL